MRMAPSDEVGDCVYSPQITQIISPWGSYRLVVLVESKAPLRRFNLWDGSCNTRETRDEISVFARFH
jgi:hypothetical protein